MKYCSTENHPSVHLAPAELVSAEGGCPVCGSVAARSGVASIQRNPEVRLLRCADCGACSASHMPRPEVLSAFYRRYYGNGQSEYSMPRVDRFVNRLLRAAPGGAGAARIRLLDFGGGDGSLGLAFARALLAGGRGRTVEFTLVDCREPAHLQGNEPLDLVHRQTLEEVDGEFDFVLASAVLNHIPELQPVMKRLFGMLAPGGWFYARTPWVAPLMRLMPGLDFTYPGHVHDLGAPFWNRVPALFHQPLRIVVSRPSLVETHFVHRPDRATAAWLLKLPARIELALSRSPRTPLWRFVGGWEVVFQKTA